MSSLKGKLVRMVSHVALPRATVASAELVGGFRRLVLTTDAPRGEAGPKAPAGTKVQLLLPSDDVRTYSPIPASEGLVLLGWVHAGAPDAVVAVTGGSALVVAVRDALRQAGVQKLKTKTYWIPGRKGLD